MIKPEYNGTSIVNLVSSIMTATGADPVYAGLTEELPADLNCRKNIILLVLDGLGYEFLMRQDPGSLFRQGLRARLTSVFPSTTASAITTFASGVATGEHAITGWFMYLKEVAAAAVILPFSPRFGKITFNDVGIDPARIFNFPSIFGKMNRECHVITKSYIKDSAYNRYALENTHKHGYNHLRGFQNQIVRTVRSNQNKKYIYAYWPDFDKNAHRFGIHSQECQEHFRLLEKTLASLLISLQNTDSYLIVTADHGLIDTSPDQIIDMQNHPRLQSLLHLPLCGEPRVPYCYVKPAKTEEFKSYVSNELAEACELYTAGELVDSGLFGTKNSNPKLLDRLGDYILLMKPGYVLHDFVEGETAFHFIGYHGNLTPDEMYVPLIIFDINK